MRAHAHDLRAEVATDFGITDADAADRLVHLIAANWRQAPLDEPNRRLCAYAVKLTRTPSAMAEADVIALRDVGFDDQAIHDATQVIAYFNYINRIADALDVAPETFIRPWEQGPAPLDT